MNAEDEGARWERPLWEDATQYPSSPDELNDWQWKWEFLKRHPRFRELIRPVRLWRIPAARALTEEKAFQSMARALRDFGASPGALITNEALSESPFVAGGGTLCRLPSRDELLADLEKAAEAGADDLLGFAKSLVWGLHLNGITDAEDEELASRYVAVRFDLAAPITPQLQKAKETVKNEGMRCGIREIKAQLSASSRDKWIRHLRVLDAKEEGATHVEIFLQFADEGLVTETADSQPNAVVSQWFTQATEVMEKVARFL